MTTFNANLIEALAAGHLAMQQCAAKAEREGLDTVGARTFVLEYLLTHGDTSGEMLVAAARAGGFACKDGRAFGAVFKTLLERGLVLVVRSDLPRVCGHGTSGGKLYRLVAQ